MTDLVTWAELGGLLAAAGGAVYARHAHPAAYWSMVGLPLTVIRLLASYSSTMDACGLTVEPSRWRALAVRATTRREIRPVPPRRGAIRPTTTGLRMRLRLAPGQEPADLAASTERLRHAWGVHAVHVRDIKPGVVELRLVGFDVLRKVRMPRRLDGGPLRIPVALREDATAFVRDYRAVPHELVLGATLSGKSMYLRNLLTGLAAQPVALVGIDCKRGVELAPFAPRLSALATEPDQAAELLPALVKEMEPYARHGVNVNVDFYSGVIYHLHGIPNDLFVPIFAVGRVPGWTVQILEQQANNILIRPLTFYDGPAPRAYVPIDQRG